MTFNASANKQWDILKELNEQINAQLHYALNSRQFVELQSNSSNLEPTDIGEEILDKFSQLIEKLVALAGDNGALEKKYNQLREAYADLNKKWFEAQEDLLLSEDRTAEALRKYNENTEKKSQLQSSESILADLEQRFEQLKRENLQLNIQIQEWKNKYVKLEKSYTTAETEINELYENNCKLTGNQANIKLETKQALTAAEKARITRERNKIIEDVKSKLEVYFCQFNEIKKKYHRLPENKKYTNLSADLLRESFQQANDNYTAFVKQLESDWLTAEVLSVKNQVDTEIITQSKFVKAVEEALIDLNKTQNNEQLSSQPHIADPTKQFSDTTSIKNEIEFLKKITDLSDSINTLPTTDINSKSNKMVLVSFSDMLKIVNGTVPEYSGCSGPNSQQELGRFIDCCEMLHNSYRDEPENQAQLLLLLKMKFKADAYDLVNRATFNSFDDLKKLLFKTYLPSRSLVEISEELQRCTQRTVETTKEFMRRIRGILNDWSEQMRRFHTEAATQRILYTEKEKEVVLIFKKGLSNAKLRDYLMMNREEKLDAIEDAALRFEETARLYTSKEPQPSTSGEFCRTIEYTEPENKRVVTPQTHYNQVPTSQNYYNQVPTTQNHYNQAPPPDYNQQPAPFIQHRWNQAQPNLQEGAYGRRNIKCNYCSLPGHYRSQCRKLEANGYCRNCRKEGHWRSNCPEGESQESWQNQLCFDCGQRGHMSRNCPAMQQRMGYAQEEMRSQGNDNVRAQDVAARTTM